MSVPVLTFVTWQVCSVVTLAKQKVSSTPRLIRRKLLSGPRTRFSSTSRTPKRCALTLSALQTKLTSHSVHPRYDHGLRRLQEGEGPQRCYCLSQRGGSYSLRLNLRTSTYVPPHSLRSHIPFPTRSPYFDTRSCIYYTTGLVYVDVVRPGAPHSHIIILALNPR